MPNPESASGEINVRNSGDDAWSSENMDIRNQDNPVERAAEMSKAAIERIKNMSFEEFKALASDPEKLSKLNAAELTAFGERLNAVEVSDAPKEAPKEAPAVVKEPKITKPEELSDKSKETIEKAKGSEALKNVVNKYPKRALAAFLAGSIALSAVVGGIAYHLGKDSKADAESGPKNQSESYEDAETVGIKDGYNEKGMYLSDNKPTELSFGSAVEVAEECDSDECEMIKYTADNQVESMASYLANMPEELQPEGFKGLTIAETETKLESLSDEEFEQVQKQFNDGIDQAFTRNVDVDGRYANVLMDKKDGSGDVDHENMEAVKCETDEHATMRQLFWTDDGTANGKEIGSLTVKIIVDEAGNIIGGCIQPLNELDSPVITGLHEKEDKDKKRGDNPTPPAPTPDPDPTPPDKEWGKSGDPHSGPNRRPSDLVDPASEVSKEQNDNTNAGNQGTPDVKPGSGSGATNNERLSGGTDQSGGGTAGNNSAPQGNPAADNKGNANQGAAQTENKPGGNNNSDSAEEKAVESGNF